MFQRILIHFSESREKWEAQKKLGEAGVEGERRGSRTSTGTIRGPRRWRRGGSRERWGEEREREGERSPCILAPLLYEWKFKSEIGREKGARNRGRWEKRREDWE